VQSNENLYNTLINRKFVKQKRRAIMIEYKFDTQLLIEGENLSEDEVNEYITKNIEGDCLLAVGDEELIKIHFHTNTPWKVLEYCSSLGDIHDIVIENMERQSNGLQG
jgi:dihydroxyacetone kinase-like predicted kinase